MLLCLLMWADILCVVERGFLQKETGHPLRYALYENWCPVMANPVDYDTRDGCTMLGAGMGAMHPMERNWQTLLRPLVYSVEDVQL